MTMKLSMSEFFCFFSFLTVSLRFIAWEGVLLRDDIYGNSGVVKMRSVRGTKFEMKQTTAGRSDEELKGDELKRGVSSGYLESSRQP